MSDHVVETVPGGALYRPSRFSGLTPGRRILALDPGLRVGWALINVQDQVRQAVAGGFLELDRDKLYASSFRFINTLLDEFGPAAVALEQYFVAPGAHCGQSIEVRGAMKAAIERAELPWTQVNPATVRASLGVRGRLKDSQIRDIVVNLLRIPAKYRPDPAKKRDKFFPADVFDAAAVGWATE